MANIALDIKANTQKALGEFKKLSRELDNKFLVQGIKLDVVKNAFKQINREFEQSLGDQGFKASESIEQRQRGLALNLANLGGELTDQAVKISDAVKDSLLEAQAEALVTGESIRDALDIAGFVSFSGSSDEVEKQFAEFSERVAKIGTNFQRTVGESPIGLLKQVAAGRARPEDLLQLDFSAAGAAGNALKARLVKFSASLQNRSREERTRLLDNFTKEIEADFNNVNNTFGRLLADYNKDSPFDVFRQEITALFSPKGLFGNLRAISDITEETQEFKNFEGEFVDRNLLQLTAKLLKTIFDREKGLFATLFNSLKDVFGQNLDILEPIATGITFFTNVIKLVSDFFGSQIFRNLLTTIKEFFGPVLNGIKAVFDGINNTVQGFNFSSIKKIDTDDINNFISGIFDAIRFGVNKITEFIKGIDVSDIGRIIGNIINEIVKTLPSFINLAVVSIGKVIETIGATLNNVSDGDIGSVLAAALNGLQTIVLKAIPVIAGAFFKALGALGTAFNESGLLGKTLIIGTIVGFFTKLFTGQGLISRVRESISKGFTNLFRGGQEGRDRRAAARFSGFESTVVRKLNDIIRLLGGNPLTDGPGGGPRGPRGPRTRNPPTRAAQERFRRRFGNRAFRQRFRNPVRGGARFRLASQVARRQGGRLLNLGPRFTQPITKALGGLRSQLSQFRAGFATTPRTARGFQIAVGGPSSPGRAFDAGKAFRGLPATISKSFSGISNRITSAFSSSSQRISGISGSVSSGITRLFSSASRRLGTLATAATNSISQVAKNIPQVASRASRVISSAARTSANVASQVASRAGRAASSAGNIARGTGGALRRLGGPLITTLLGGFAIADILGRKTDAAEMEGLTPEEKREQRRRDEREKTRGVLGVLGGIGGGALAGAGVGAALGAAGANPFTVAVGGVLGSIIGGIIGEEAVRALGDDIIDGVTGFAKQVGGFFSGLWQSTSQLAGDGWRAVTDFFGKKGPIQSTFRFIGDLPGNIVDKMKDGFSNISETLSSLPSNIWEGIKSGLSKLNPFDEPGKRFLGGAGSGMTLVGENGPELVNLGTASVVTPQSSFAGLGLNRAAGPQVNNIVINVNAPGANEFADQLSNDVMNRLEEQFNYASSLAP